ncbi:MAG: cytochrome c3 family protein [Acidobacteriota bacterium]
MLLGRLGAAGALAADSWAPGRSPPPRLPLIFAHARHLARGAQCAQCHPDAAASRSAVDNLLPTEAQCRACHAIERDQPAKQATPVAACAGCHVGFAPDQTVARVYLTPTPLKFDHSAHAQTACESCHPVRDVDLATQRELPTMTSCLSCHRDGSEQRHCADCHLTKLGGLVETSFPHGELVPQRSGLGDDHGPGFAQHHEQQARQVGATCNACHDQSECVACHKGVVKPMDFHPGNYLLAHAVDARRGRPDCSACHRYQSFCVACHERSGLATRGDTQFNSAEPNHLFHPVGWATTTGIGPNLHAQEARRNISSCTSCHREEDCLKCHSADSGNMVHASPHPPGWRGSARCRALDRGNRRMCLRCHVTQDELGCDWKASP